VATIDKLSRDWPNALDELNAKLVANEPVILWIRDTQLEFTIGSMKRENNGYLFTLTSGRGVDAYIETDDESNTVELSFYSKGQP